MKQERIIKIRKDEFKSKSKELELFKYALTIQKETDKHYIVSICRELDDKTLFKLENLEDEYNSYNNPSFIPVYVLIGLTIILFTLFVILNFVVHLEFLISFVSFLLPAILLFIAGSALMLINTNKVNRIINNKEKEINRIKKEISDL